MAPITQLTLYALHIWRIMFNCNELPEDHDIRGVKKSVAIVGAGSAGLAALKTILDLTEETIANWDIVLYEKRWDVGGVWYCDTSTRSNSFLISSPTSGYQIPRSLNLLICRILRCILCSTLSRPTQPVCSPLRQLLDTLLIAAHSDISSYWYPLSTYDTTPTIS